MRKLIFIMLLVSFSAVYYYATLHDENSIAQQTISDVKRMVKNSTVFKKDVSAGVSRVEKTDSTNQALNSTISLQNLPPVELRRWIMSESHSMNSANHNTEEKQIQLKAQALSLGPEQFETLKEIATNSGLSINSRTLSAYLISLNPSAQSQQALFDVASSEVPDFGPILPHSESELKHTQELAIRYMQIDELFQKAKTDANAFDKLKLLVQTAPSEQVRSYAQKKLQELK